MRDREPIAARRRRHPNAVRGVARARRRPGRAAALAPRERRRGAASHALTIRRTPLGLPAIAAVVVLAAAVAGCGLLRRPEIRHFALEPIAPAAPPAAVSTAALAGPPLGLDAVELPPGLDRRGIVVRDADHRLEVRGTDLWAASLESMVLHALAFDLAHRLPEGMVVLPGQAQPAGGMRSLDVAFEELAAGPERQVVLDARWTLRTPGAADLTGRERVVEPLASLDSAEIAAGTSRALAGLAERIVASLGGR